MEQLRDGFEYANYVDDEEEGNWYTPKEDWSELPKDFLPPPGTYNLSFVTEINLRALDTITQKENHIKEQNITIEKLETQNRIYEEQIKMLTSKNEMLISRLKTMQKT